MQPETTPCSCMQEAPPFGYLPEAAAGMLPHLARMVRAAPAFTRARGAA